MPHFHPSIPPLFLSERMRDAERAVWEIFKQLDLSWHVFYSPRENSESGYDREVDFVLIRLNRIFYCEVKGGVVVVDQRAGPGVTWAHFTRSGEAIKKRADPKQLWTAKRNLSETIRQIAGETPRNLGFREHSLYIFPHTPRLVTQGVDLEREYIHYVFEEDISNLPVRLQQIADIGKGKFIDHDRIVSIINSLDTMVLREREGMLPQSKKTAHSPFLQNPPQGSERVTQHSMQGDQNVRAMISSLMRRPLRWRVMAIVFGFLIVVAYLSDFSVTPTGWSKIFDRKSGESVGGSRQVPEKSGGMRSPVPAKKPSAQDPNKILPSFISAAAAGDVERAIAAAQDQAVYISWRNENQHGLVILLDNQENGCRRYQISRHDVQPTKYDTVLRCPSTLSTK